MASEAPHPHADGSGSAARVDLPERAEVVVIGAGLAGLAAAINLQGAGREVIVLEAADAAGGRVRTDVVDGFRLDRGFQLYNPAYPEGRRMLDHDALDLRGFERGALLHRDGRTYRVGDPRSHPDWTWDALRAPLGGPLPLARFGAYATRCATVDPRSMEDRPDVDMATALADHGAGGALTENLLRPFLSGVFLEPDLATSRRYGDLVLRSFARGTPSVPAAGMQAIADQLAGRVHHLHLATPVQAIDGSTVRTARGALTADAIVVAVDPASVPGLLPGRAAPATNSCTTWYHVPDQSPRDLAGGLPILTVASPGCGPLLNSAVMTHAAPTYAPPGKSLVSSTALGLAGDTPEPVIRDQLAALYGVSTARWDLVAVYEVPHALPRFVPPQPVRQPAALGNGIFIAGDHRDTPSIQGALVSGRRAAAAITAAATRSEPV
ncbi:MAG: hypothetical protein RLZ55_1011 [Actinomycetota bacterium]